MPKRRARGEGTIYQRKDGLWSGQITLPDGKRKTKYHRSQAVVRNWLTDQRQAIHHGVWSSTEDMTVAVFLHRYLADVAASRIRPQTLRSYTDRVNNHIIPAIGKLKLSALRPDHVQQLYADLQRDGLSAGTILISHSVLRQAFNQAEAWNLIGRNPVTMAKPPRIDHDLPSMLTKEELACFLEATKGHWIHTIVVLAVTTGLRKGELLGLYWKDVDLEQGVLEVKHGLVHVGGETYLSEPKTKRGLRRVTLPPIAVQELVEFRQSSWTEMLFPNQRSQLMHPSSVNQIWLERLDALGIPRATFHSLRHLHSTMLLEAGISAKVVQERLGHASIAVTLGIYSHVTAGLECQAADAIQKQFDS